MEFRLWLECGGCWNYHIIPIILAIIILHRIIRALVALVEGFFSERVSG